MRITKMSDATVGNLDFFLKLGELLKVIKCGDHMAIFAFEKEESD